jgi:diguanylate cyclase (GGDEF)-like protein
MKTCPKGEAGSEKEGLRIAWLAAGAFLLAASQLFASGPRNVRFERLSIEQGLSQSGVNSILQDDRGFMWFGTQDGLNRYDGYTFTVFKHDSLDPASLSNSTVWALHQDRKGSLWIGTEAGLDLWDRERTSFVHFRSEPGNQQSLSHDRVRAILETRDGALWIGTDGGLNAFNGASRTFTRFVHSPADSKTLSSDRVRAIFEDRDGVLWIGTDGGGLNAFDRATRTFRHYSNDPADPRSLSDDRVRCVFEDRDGFLWVGTYEGGLSRLDRASGTFARFQRGLAGPKTLSENRVRAIFQDRDGILWAGTDGGLNEWRPESRSFVAYRNAPADAASLSDDRVMSIYQDRAGVLWVGTQGGGVNKWNMATESFALFRVDPSGSSTFSGNTVSAFCADAKGSVWVGTYNGLNRLDRRTGAVETFRKQPGGLTDDRVFSLLADRAGILWIGTYEGGLNRLDPKSGRFTSYRNDPKDPGTLAGNGVTSLYEDKKGVLWIGVYRGGLNRYEPSTGRFTRYVHDAGNPKSLSDDRVIALAGDASGTLWIGTEGGGLNRLDEASGTFTRYRHDPKQPSSLSGDIVFAVHEDRLGALWVGTQGAGLDRWGREDRRVGRASFQKYGERQGLPNNTIYGLLEDEDGNLWMSTNKGLARLDPRTGGIRTYDKRHGLQSNEFNFGAAYRSGAGEMFFGGNEGFNAFFPNRIRRNNLAPPVVLTALEILNRDVKLPREFPGSGLTLTYRDSVVSFEFAALDYASPDRNRYSYKLDGFDRDWVEAHGTRRATYTNLDPGKYVFRVRGANSDGVWNQDGESLPVTVLAPPWRTWWARTLYVLAALAVLFAFWRGQVRKVAREAEYRQRLEVQVEDRTSELAQRNQQLELANTRLEEASLTDSLTGLGNRRFLMSSIHQEIALVERFYAADTGDGKSNPPSKPDFVLMMVDLDGLKTVNDGYGHEAGDRALIEMRDVLERACRRSDTIIRWGGDEFLILGRSADAESAKTLAERIRMSIEQHPFDLGVGRPVYLSASIGFAFYPFFASAPKDVTWEQVGTVADRALYTAKSSGRNGWVGILSNPDAPADPDFVHLINHRPDLLASEGFIQVCSSFIDSREVVWRRQISRGDGRREEVREGIEPQEERKEASFPQLRFEERRSGVA